MNSFSRVISALYWEISSYLGNSTLFDLQSLLNSMYFRLPISSCPRRNVDLATEMCDYIAMKSAFADYFLTEGAGGVIS